MIRSLVRARSLRQRCTESDRVVPCRSKMRLQAVHQPTVAILKAAAASINRHSDATSRGQSGHKDGQLVLYPQHSEELAVQAEAMELTPGEEVRDEACPGRGTAEKMTEDWVLVRVGNSRRGQATKLRRLRIDQHAELARRQAHL